MKRAYRTYAFFTLKTRFKALKFAIRVVVGSKKILPKIFTEFVPRKIPKKRFFVSYSAFLRKLGVVQGLYEGRF